jgi:sulfate transport system substrate-binding protein
MRNRLRAALALTAVSLLAVTACGGDDSSSEAAGTTAEAGATTTAKIKPSTISIVGFAVPETANKAIAAEWVKTPEGAGVTFKTSYGASGDQSRAVVAGLEADYVHLSVASDVTRLVDAGLVADDWDDGPNKGIVSSSIVVFAVRKGNPENIRTWDDLVKPGIGIVTPNPASSGAARWNALAAWGQVISNGGTEADAKAYVDKFFANVVSLPSSGRDATTAFIGGTGDVLMAYENEAILARQKGEDFDYIIPDTTMLIENPGAVLKDANPKAKDWLNFVLSADGQRQFARTGFRPIIDDVDYGDVEGAEHPSDPYPAVKNLLTVSGDFESWSALSEKYFDEKAGIITAAIAASGKAG